VNELAAIDGMSTVVEVTEAMMFDKEIGRVTELQETRGIKDDIK
jgi:hypothetical protein